jgi:4-diphosphocytidyl-2-C-methyl-D-erythritol kinase
MTCMSETAYAKINLALHVRRRRDDGYHEIETLFAFLDDGDTIELEPAAEFQLKYAGEFGAALSEEPMESNLITRAVRSVFADELPKVCLTLTKRLPIASGLGGGSADAAATIRILVRYFGIAIDIDEAQIMQIASDLGADVPACFASVPMIGRGIGASLDLIRNDVTGLSCLLVNPRVPLATGPVFASWNGQDRGPMPDGSARVVMAEGRNDLEASAISICPVIEDVLARLRQTKPLLTRMSGSGASCFALYEDERQASQAANDLGNDHPDWWQMLGRLR